MYELCLLLSDAPPTLAELQRMGNFKVFCGLPAPLPLPRSSFEYYLCLGIALAALCGHSEAAKGLFGYSVSTTGTSASASSNGDGEDKGDQGGPKKGGRGKRRGSSVFSEVHTAQLVTAFDSLKTSSFEGTKVAAAVSSKEAGKMQAGVYGQVKGLYLRGGCLKDYDLTCTQVLLLLRQY